LWYGFASSSSALTFCSPAVFTRVVRDRFDIDFENNKTVFMARVQPNERRADDWPPYEPEAAIALAE